MVSEDLCFKRLAVAHKRQDWRMYAQGLARLSEEIGHFRTRSQARWRRLFEEAKGDPAFPAELLERLETVLSGLVAEVAQETPPPPIALVSWTHALSETERIVAEALPVKLRGGISDWIDRANLLGALGQTEAWTDSLFWSLRNSLKPKALTPPPGVVVLTDDPGLSEGDPYKLQGSVDWFYCPACQHLSVGHERALVLSCEHCGGPSRPLIVPLGGQFFPNPIRKVWENAHRALTEAPAWILVEPPLESDPILEMLEGLVGEKPVLVRSERPNVIQTWSGHWPGLTTSFGGPNLEQVVERMLAKEK